MNQHTTIPYLPRSKGTPKTMSRIEAPSLDRARAIAASRLADVVDVVSAAVDLYDDVHNARVFLTAHPENDILTVDQAKRRSRKGGSK